LQLCTLLDRQHIEEQSIGDEWHAQISPDGFPIWWSTAELSSWNVPALTSLFEATQLATRTTQHSNRSSQIARARRELSKTSGLSCWGCFHLKLCQEEAETEQ